MSTVRHLVMVRLRDGFTPAEKRSHTERIKRELEALGRRLDGVKSFTVHIDPLPTSDIDILFDSVFASKEGIA
ncbi:MAG: Dabb family protein [Planctomycetaceae bacterium]|nr:Dabb family protein [Planctomycetaceae bacterium]